MIITQRGTIQYLTADQSDCVWFIHPLISNPNLKLFLIFDQFEIDDSDSGCSQEYIELWEQYSTHIGYTRPRKFCNKEEVITHQRSLTKPYNSDLALKFVSNGKHSSAGFAVTYIHSTEGMYFMIFE